MIDEESRGRRSKLEIYYHILKLCIKRNGQAPSDLYEMISISYGQVKDYTEDLCQLGMLQINGNGKLIKTTTRGKLFVKKFDYLMKQIK